MNIFGKPDLRRAMVSIMLTILLFLISASPVAAAESETIIRIKLGGSHTRIKLEFPSGGVIKNERGRRIRRLGAKDSFTWELPTARRRKQGTKYDGQTLTFESGKEPAVFNGKAYRGFFTVKFATTGAIVVNHVGLEDYLRGVVGSEIGSRSPAETLKAQTVIARTYAYASRGKHGRDGADLCDSTHCQVYNGVKAERSTLDPAISATRGVIMISNGKPIETLYHATCGGMTSDNDKVFGGSPRSYLRRVVCPFCTAGNNYRWTRSISANDLRTRLAGEKIYFRRLFDLSYESAQRLDRVDSVILHTDKGQLKVRGTVIRRLFGLPSTTFVIGNRSTLERILATAIPIKPSTTAAHKLPGVMLASLHSDAISGPPQLILQTARGLARTIRPDEGWKTIAWGISDEKLEAEEKNASQTRVLAKKLSSVQNNKIEVFGRGFGHQVGLCQAGAIEMGKRNWSYRQILAYYYSNAALRSLGY